MGNKNYAIILGAGKGTRMGEKTNKVYLPLEGRPLISRTLEAFYKAPRVHEIVVVVSPGEECILREEVLKPYPPKKPLRIALGGTTRQDSVYNGLQTLPKDGDIVIIHDGARALVTPEIIDRSIEVAKIHGAAVAGMPVKDTIKQVNNNSRVEKTLDREALWLVQTPQTFRYSLIMEAHSQAQKEGFVATDDSALVESLGRQVYMVEGGYDNLKITTPEDLIIGEEILLRRERE